MEAAFELPEERQRAGLSALLKQCRTRIRPGARSLGPYLRLSVRTGKAVRQEEVAEAADISP